MISSSDILPFFPFCRSAALEATSPSTHVLGAGMGSMTERVYTCTTRQNNHIRQINKYRNKPRVHKVCVLDLRSSCALVSGPRREEELRRRRHRRCLWYSEKRVQCLFWRADLKRWKKVVNFHKDQTNKRACVFLNTYRLRPRGESVFFCDWKKKSKKRSSPVNQCFTWDKKKVIDLKTKE